MISSVAVKKKRSNAGFTLIELVLVTTIILVIVGLSIPRFQRSFSDLTIRNTALDMSKLMNYARESAIIQRKNFKMSFDALKGRYQVQEIDNSVVPSVYKKSNGRLGKMFIVPQGVVLAATKSEVVFYPDGRSDEARVDLKDKSGSGYMVLIKGHGSHIEVKGFANAS